MVILQESPPLVVDVRYDPNRSVGQGPSDDDGYEDDRHHDDDYDNNAPPSLHIWDRDSHSTRRLPSYHWTSMTRVCRYWRSVALKDPSFWRIINVDYPLQMVERCLERSGMLPLRYVRCDIRSPESLSILKMILSQLSRIERLYIEVREGHWSRSGAIFYDLAQKLAGFGQPLNNFAPMLKSFTLEQSSGVPDSSSVFRFLIPTLVGFHGLTSLILWNPHPSLRIPSQSLLFLVHHLRYLEDLQLGSALAGPDPNLPSPQPHSVAVGPAFSSLTIDDENAHELGRDLLKVMRFTGGIVHVSIFRRNLASDFSGEVRAMYDEIYDAYHQAHQKKHIDMPIHQLDITCTENDDEYIDFKIVLYRACSEGWHSEGPPFLTVELTVCEAEYDAEIDDDDVPLLKIPRVCSELALSLLSRPVTGEFSMLTNIPFTPQEWTKVIRQLKGLEVLTVHGSATKTFLDYLVEYFRGPAVALRSGDADNGRNLGKKPAALPLSLDFLHLYFRNATSLNHGLSELAQALKQRSDIQRKVDDLGFHFSYDSDRMKMKSQTEQCRPWVKELDVSGLGPWTAYP
ncbi:hypothetical protein BDN72DRAFT_850526 [Pluteus cervinus]|uniref:Uncharacterized protein n=1 Tax=Pluteus cervinus TaxID=181527 RepID=A0ACD3A3Y5_9AGAR|nr:hypothetical protein BDN72DRAFT_850526 [Pluteus cervinus]